MEKKLQVRHLRISFRTTAGKVQAVRDISFDLHKGETMAIVGESGSGKSVTSKAILGILAGNAIVEGGEILYDGQDLLKIGEDDFYRLRGDKIAMIFQDPLSSLNPIMRIGKQLTEAMLLKGKARQRSSKENFHGKLNMLEKFMTQAPGADAAAVKEKCDQFRKFELKHIELEQGYNTAAEAAREALEETNNILFLIEKNAFKDDCAAQLRQVKEFALHAENPFVVSERAEELKTAAGELTKGVGAQVRSGDFSQTVRCLQKIKDILTQALDKGEPDFFALGYYQTFGSGSAPAGTVKEKNAFYTRYLEEHFLNDFMGMVQAGVAYAERQYAQHRAAALLNNGLFTLIGVNNSQRIKAVHTLSMHLVFVNSCAKAGKNIIGHSFAAGLAAHTVLVIKEIEDNGQTAFMRLVPKLSILIHSRHIDSFPNGAAA